MLPNGSSPCLTNNGLLYIATMVTKINVSRIVRCSSPRAANGTVSEAEGKFDNYGVYDQLSDQWKPGDEWRIFLYSERAGSQRKTKVDVGMMVEVLLLLSFVRFCLLNSQASVFLSLLTRLCSFAQSRR